MGSLRKRNGKWNAQVRISGWRYFSQTFNQKSDAKSTPIIGSIFEWYHENDQIAIKGNKVGNLDENMYILMKSES